MSEGEGFPQSRPDSLLAHIGTAGLDEAGFQETAWIEVIRKMDEVYSDLLQYEVDLERKNAALEEAQRFIKSVLSSMSDVLLVTDADGRIREVNAAVVEMTGFDANALIGKPVRDLIVEPDEQVMSDLCGMAGGGGGLREYEIRLVSAKGGTTDLVAMNCSVRFDHHGRPRGRVLIGRPVGELRRAYSELNKAHADLKQAQKQLLQQEKMASLGRLVAGVAHELNNPISFINGNVHALGKYRERMTRYLDAIHAGVDADQRERLRKELRVDHMMADLVPLVQGTIEGADRVTEIIKNLRRISFPEGDQTQIFDLAEVVRTAALWAAKGRNRGTDRTEVRLSGPLPMRGREGQLHQVIVNLVQNALDAIGDGDGGRVVIEAGAAGGQVRLRVSDNGPGIQDKHLLKVFDPFFTTKDVGEGTGLGLWISYGIVRDHGGEIEATNLPEGGACFIVTLPAADAVNG